MSEQPANEMNWTSRDIDAAQNILAKAVPRSALLPAPKPELLITLSDEEIRVLDGPSHGQLVAMPWLEVNASDNADTVNKVAMRGLMARGLVRPLGIDPERDEMMVEVPDHIRGTLVLRRTGEKIVVITINTSLGKQLVYGYVHIPDPDVGHAAVLAESVSDAGMHEFTISSLEDFINRGVNLLDLQGNAHRDSEETSYTVAEFENGGQGLPELADSRVVTTVAVATKGESTDGTNIEVLTFYAGTSTLRILKKVGDKLHMREVTHSSAGEEIGALVGNI